MKFSAGKDTLLCLSDFKTLMTQIMMATKVCKTAMLNDADSF